MADFVAKVRQILVDDRYSLIHKLGEGGWAVVYLAHDVVTGEDVALKLEHYRVGDSLLRREQDQYAEFQDLPGFPRLLSYGEHGEYSVLAMQLLGPTLEDLLEYCGGTFSLSTTLQLADQLLERLQAMHARGWIHRDITPANCLIGAGADAGTVYLNDFGIAHFFNVDEDAERRDDPRDMDPDDEDSESLVGTARFASICAHRGRVYRPYDDLESLGYMLIYFARGRLPWQGLAASNHAAKDRAIRRKKLTTTVEELCAGLPPAFAEYMRRVRVGSRAGAPDHEGLRALFRRAAREQGIEYDGIFDWTVRRYHELKGNSPG